MLNSSLRLSKTRNVIFLFSHLSRPISQIKGYHQSSQTLDFFDQILQQTTTLNHCKQLQTQILTSGSNKSAFLASRLVSVYARFGAIDYAWKVFDEMPEECLTNLLLWNSILRANLTNGCYEKVVNLYFRMRKIGVFGDGFTFPLVIKACAFIGDGNLGEILHDHIAVLGYQSHLHVANELLLMYGRFGRMEDASRVFDRMGVRSYISWNTMVSGFAMNCDRDGAVEMFKKMESEGLEPNAVTWTSLLSSHARRGFYNETMELFRVMLMRGVEVNAEVLSVVLSVCADAMELDRGKVIHGFVVKGGFEHYLFVKNALICVYGKCKGVEDARKLFVEMGTKNTVTWNSLITSYAEAGLCEEAFAVFSQLRKSNGCPMLEPNVVSWSAVIDAFASQGHGEESLNLFREMQLAKVMANPVTILTVLSVCANLASLNLGREVHGHVIRSSMDGNMLVGNGLVNMYTKCGCLREGNLIFQNIVSKDLVSWNSMITGYGTHGYGEDALQLYDQMIRSDVMPDAVTFVAVLSACSHSGFVDEGRRLFDDMISRYKIEPQLEHYASMVDLLGRAGLLQEASDLVKSMPMEPNVCVRGALLNSCRMHRNTEVAEEIATQFFGLPSEMTGSYMLLSNLYAAMGRWDDSAKVRASAKIKGFRKVPGQSWIQINNKVHRFLAGNNVSLGLEEVYVILEELALNMESEGYMRAKSFDNSDIIDEEIQLIV